MSQIQQGDQVRPGQQIMKVVDAAQMQIEAAINQAESDDFRIGQTARIRLDAFPGLELPGKIYTIGALATGGWRQNNYIRNIPVRVAILGSDNRVIPDLSASADVLLATAENQTIVPLSGLESQDGATVAYVKKGETFEVREVQLGLKNDTHAAVLAGLSPGDEVRLN